tara:strand:+ start:8526 stop:8702 length:177 start_codon:yes stop_codon:yes gene_type:complete
VGGGFMNKTNQHRVGKHPFQAYLTDEEKAVTDKAKEKAGVRTNRELILALSGAFISKP